LVGVLPPRKGGAFPHSKRRSRRSSVSEAFLPFLHQDLEESGLMTPAVGAQDTANFLTVLLGDTEPDPRDGEHFAVGAGSKLDQSHQGPVGKNAEGGHAEPPGLGQPPRAQRLFHLQVRLGVRRPLSFLFRSRGGIARR